MNIYHAANPRVFENVHALNYQSVEQLKLRRQLLHLWRPGKSVKNRVEIMQRVSDFVERMKKVVFKSTVFIKRILFKKE